MGDIFVYILKSSLCLALFYLFFKLLLCGETFHRFNRVVLLSLFVISLSLPLIEITFSEETPYSELTLNLDSLLAISQEISENPESADNGSNIAVVLFIVYITGAVITTLASAISFTRMFLLLSGGTKEIVNKEYTLIIHRKPVAPFSWMKFIAISEDDYRESGKEIILHEVAHIRKRHTVDLLIAEAVKIIHWFNPASWLLKQELQSLHEYQADEAVLKNGIDAKKYQLLLIKKAVGDRLYSIANSFNHSKLKNRITMITKKKSKRIVALKALVILPLSLLAVVSFASAKVADVLEPVSELKITDFIQNDTIKKEVRNVVILKDTVTPKSQSMSYSYNSVKIENGKQDKLGFSYYFDSNLDTVKGKKGKISISYSMKQGDSTVKKCDTTITLNYRIRNAKPLVIINGKEDSLFLNNPDPTGIESIVVLKDASATAIYGEKAKNGVIIITLKSGLKEEKDETQGVVKNMIRLHGGIRPLYVVNGEVMENFEMSSLPPERIKSIQILKDDNAVKKYGEKGKNGVIEITLK
jgi:TonB-dependent SusC/RagA subfamily outer membrane receptor